MNDASNDELRVTYIIRSHVEMTTGDSYKFNGTNTMETDTGTPLIETQDIEYVNVSGRRMIGWKQLIAVDPSDPTKIDVTMLLEVEDSTGNGIPGIKFMDYIPNWTMNHSQYKGNITVGFYNGSWWTWNDGENYTVNDNGSTTLPDPRLENTLVLWPMAS